MTKPNLLDELCAAIANGSNHFNMECFFTDGTYRLDRINTQNWCGTQSCMAGHIIALRKELAEKFLPLCSTADYVNYGMIARTIWEHEMGSKCRLDFFADLHPLGPDSMGTIRREEALEHIRGTSKHWRQLDDEQYELLQR